MNKPFLFFNGVLQRTGSEVIASHIHTLAGDYSYKKSLEVRFNFDVKLIKKDSDCYTLFYESTEPLLFADGTVDYASMSYGHMSDKSLYDKYSVGDIIPAGALAYKEGTRSGGKDGAVLSHTHVRIHKGKFKSPYWEKTSTGNWDLVTTGGKMHHYDAFFVLPETEILKVGENPADYYQYIVYTGQTPFETWFPANATLLIQATQVNRRETPNGTKLSGGFAPVGEHPIVEATKDAVGGYQWVRCEGFQGWVALMDNATIWIDPIIEEPGPIDPPVIESELEKVIEELNKIIDDLRTQISLVSAEIKVKDSRIIYLEGIISQTEKELDATILSANEKQKKITDALNILGC